MKLLISILVMESVLFNKGFKKISAAFCSLFRETLLLHEMKTRRHSIVIIDNPAKYLILMLLRFKNNYHRKNTKKQRIPQGVRCFRLNQEILFSFAQLLVAFVAELGELLGLGEQFFGLCREGLHE